MHEVAGPWCIPILQAEAAARAVEHDPKSIPPATVPIRVKGRARQVGSNIHAKATSPGGGLARPEGCHTHMSLKSVTG